MEKKVKPGAGRRFVVGFLGLGLFSWAWGHVFGKNTDLCFFTSLATAVVWGTLFAAYGDD